MGPAARCTSVTMLVMAPAGAAGGEARDHDEVIGLGWMTEADDRGGALRGLEGP